MSFFKGSQKGKSAKGKSWSGKPTWAEESWAASQEQWPTEGKKSSSRLQGNYTFPKSALRPYADPTGAPEMGRRITKLSLQKVW